MHKMLSTLSSFPQGGLKYNTPQALGPVIECNEYEGKEKITMSELVVKGCVLKSVDPVHELESQYRDIKQIQDDLNEDGIDLFCNLAEGNKAAKQKAHDMARHLSELAKHTTKMRSRFMDASITKVDENESIKTSNLKEIQELNNKIQRLTSENREIDIRNEKINQFIARIRDKDTCPFTQRQRFLERGFQRIGADVEHMDED